MSRRSDRSGESDAAEYFEPQIGFAWNTVAGEAFGDFALSGFADVVLWVRGKLRPHQARDLPASPDAPTTLIAPGLVHAVRQVLEMHAGIADKNVGRRVAQKPSHGSVGQGPFRQDWLVAPQIGAERAIERKNRPGCEAALPEAVRVGERGQVEVGVARFAVGGKRGGSHAVGREGEDRARRQRGRHRGETWSRRCRYKFNLARPGRCAHNRDLQTDASAPAINEVTGWKWLLLWFAATLLRIWGRTLRFQVSPEDYARFTKSDEPALVVLWHNRLFLSAEMFRRYRTKRRVYGLVSASKDGAWLAAFYRLIGIYPVRGSSSNFGREAARTLIEVIKQGHDIGITPDGPRGPLYALEPGALVVSRRTQAPMLLFGAEFTRAWQLKSWDRFYIPVPFSRVIMRCTVLPVVDATGRKLEADEVRAALLAVNPDRGRISTER